MKKKDMTKKAFVAWLRKRPRATFTTGDNNECPVGRFVGGQAALLKLNNKGTPPPWMNRFAAAFDRKFTSFGFDVTVTAARILREMKL